MKYCKKLALFFVVFLTVFSLVVGAAFADPGNGKGKGQWKFKDLDKNHWAAKQVQAMCDQGIISGYADMTFQPNKPVTKLEAIVLIEKALDKDAASEAASQKINFVNRQLGWGAGFVALAVEKGMLTEEEAAKLNPNQPAKRIEIARYLVNTLDLGTDYDSADFEDLGFKDGAEVSSSDREIVCAVIKNGIMFGSPNGTFQPNKPLKRVELAVLVYRLVEGKWQDNGNDNRENQESSGQFVKLEGEDSIIILQDGQPAKYDLADTVDVTVGGREKELDDLLFGYKVDLTVNSDGKVSEINANGVDNSILKLTGKIDSIDADREEFALRVDGRGCSVTFTVDTDSDTKFYTIENDRKYYYDFDTLKEDCSVTIEGEAVINSDLKIKAASVKILDAIEDNAPIEQIDGQFIQADNSHIVILKNEELVQYPLHDGKDTKVTIGGEEESLGDLRFGSGVELKLNADDEAIEVTAQRSGAFFPIELTGQIESVNKDPDTFALEVKGDDCSVIFTVNTDRDTDYYKLASGHQDSIDFEDLDTGDTATVSGQTDSGYHPIIMADKVKVQ